MRKMTYWRAWLLTALAALTPGVANAQSDSTGYAPPDPVCPVPLYSTHPENGGLFLAADFVMMRQTNPIHNQGVAFRGFIAIDDSVLGPGTAGTHVGSFAEALNTHQVSGPNDFQPGFKVEAGWKFGDGSALTVSWMYLVDHKTHASATLLPRDERVGSNFSESFLTSPVTGIPPEFSGPPNKISVGDPTATFGIWNAASVMNIEFIQRTQQYDATYRYPVYENENYRLSALVGPRFFWIWERFKWRTVDIDVNGASGPLDVGIYTNITSNRMYGVHTGCQQECYLGHGFAAMIDLEAAVFADVVREKVKYELGLKFSGPQAKRTITDYSVVPEIEGRVGLMWYPCEGVQIQIGYDAMAFFNTVGMQQPISFNFSDLNPHYLSTFRLFDGWRAGIAITF